MSSPLRRLVRSIGPFVSLGLLAQLGVGCQNPDRAILERMNQAEQERFLSGRDAAGRCWICHDLAGTVKKVGPSLLGVYGRQSGTAPDYQASDAMITASIVWDDRSLSAFLANPAGFVPGNRMVSKGVDSPRAMADLLFYLRNVTRPGARAEADE
jgi:cytochrome c